MILTRLTHALLAALVVGGLASPSAGCGRLGFTLEARAPADSGGPQQPSPGGAGDDAGDGLSTAGGPAAGTGGADAGATDAGGAGASGANADAGGGNDAGGRNDAGGGWGGLDGGVVDVCVADVCASDVDRCTSDPDKTSPGICGCDTADDLDDDADGTPDCIDLCPNAPDVLADGSCGCAAAAADDDDDGVENCQDLCPDDGDKAAPEICGCGISDDDEDDDELPDCADACSDDGDKVVPGMCGCGVVESTGDTDDDGLLDCVDTCGGLDDASYVPDASCGVGHCLATNTPSSCASGIEAACLPGAPLSADDATCDDVDDDCDGSADEEHVATPSTCGSGACASTGSVTCVDGDSSDSCVAGSGAADDTTCDGVDDDCDGVADEDYVATPTSCGIGACLRSGSLICSGGTTSNTCSPGAPAGSDATCNGIDDDCSGTADEDYVPDDSCGVGYCHDTNTPSSCTGGVVTDCAGGTALDDVDVTLDGVDDDCDGTPDDDVCVPATQTFGVGAHTPAPPAHCTTATIKLWGAGGASGSANAGYWASVTGGLGGPGGYATRFFSVSAASVISLNVGGGGQNCPAAGTNPNTSYSGGAAGTGRAQVGAVGAGTEAGGSGGNSSSGGDGGAGFFGGGGGGAGTDPGYAPHGPGGGGGAATVIVVDGVRLLAGGGGGGGGAGSDFTTAGHSGGNAGSGCSGVGLVATAQGGGGGGGGKCDGTTNQPGTGRLPYTTGVTLPAGTATGGNNTADCQPGGGGYAIVEWGP